MKFLTLDTKNNYLLVPDLLWDGIAEKPTRGMAVLVNKGIMTKVSPISTFYNSSIDNLELIELRGVTLMPGLVDCHIHFAMNGNNLYQAIDDWQNNLGAIEKNYRSAAANYLNNGVIAVRDGGDKMGIGLTVSRKIKDATFPGPLVIATGHALYMNGKYGEFLGPGADSVEDLLNQIVDFNELGIDQLKVAVSGLVSFKKFGVVGPVQFSVPSLSLIVKKAHHAGLKVMAHASSDEAVRTAVLSGVDSIEHGYFVKRDTLELMARAGIALVPTLAPLGNLVTGGFSPYAGADMEVIRRTFNLHLVTIREASELGVPIGIGTDAGANHVLHGYSYHDEIEYLLMAGLHTRKILQMATSISAQILGLGNIIGTVVPGKKPFLIGVIGNPFESLKVLTKPRYVIISS